MADDVKLDRYPDDGWGMAISPDEWVDPETAYELIIAIRKQNEAKYDG